MTVHSCTSPNNMHTSTPDISSESPDSKQVQVKSDRSTGVKRERQSFDDTHSTTQRKASRTASAPDASTAAEEQPTTPMTDQEMSELREQLKKVEALRRQGHSDADPGKSIMSYLELRKKKLSPEQETDITNYLHQLDEQEQPRQGEAIIEPPTILITIEQIANHLKTPEVIRRIDLFINNLEITTTVINNAVKLLQTLGEEKMNEHLESLALFNSAFSGMMPKVLLGEIWNFTEQRRPKNPVYYYHSRQDLYQTEGIENVLEKLITKCRQMFYERVIFAPYFALVQSSGSGKTTCMRLIGNMKQFRSAYLLLNDHGGPPTQEFFTAIQSACSETDETKACTIIWEYLDELIGNPSSSQDEIFVLCMDEARCLVNIKAHYRPTAPANAEIKSPEAGHSSTTKAGTSESTAHNYRNALVLFRKALHGFTATQSKKRKIVVILADTVSTVANFVPTYNLSPRHLRATDPFTNNLFPAIYNIPFIDVQRKQIIQEGQILEGLFFLKPERLVELGRPLWYSTYEAERKTKSVEESVGIVLDLAKRKLTANKSHEKKAALASILSLEITSQRLTTELIADSLAYCTHVSTDRERITCRYISEPIVAEAARQVIGNVTTLEALTCLKQLFVQNNVNTGDIGETVSQVVLLGAYENCAKKRMSQTGVGRLQFFLNSGQVPLRQFLKQLLAESTYRAVVGKEQENANIPKELFVFFNHFVELGGEITIEILKAALQRCCALKLKKGTQGVDLAIPVYHGNTGELYAVLWVQVKAELKLSVPEILNTMRTKMIPSFIFKTHAEQAEFDNLQHFGLFLNTRAKLSESANNNLVFSNPEQFAQIFVDLAKNLGAFINLDVNSQLTEQLLDPINVTVLKKIATRVGITLEHSKLTKNEVIQRILEYGKTTVMNNQLDNARVHVFENGVNALSSFNDWKLIFSSDDSTALFKEIISMASSEVLENIEFATTQQFAADADQLFAFLELYT